MAFTDLVNACVRSFITPLIAAIFRGVSFSVSGRAGHCRRCAEPLGAGAQRRGAGVSSSCAAPQDRALHARALLACGPTHPNCAQTFKIPVVYLCPTPYGALADQVVT